MISPTFVNAKVALLSAETMRTTGPSSADGRRVPSLSGSRAAYGGRSQRSGLRGRRGSGLGGSERVRGDGIVVSRENSRDDAELGPDLHPDDLSNEARAECDQPDDIVEVAVVVHAPDPGRIRGAGLGHRRENADDPHEEERQEYRPRAPRTHGPLPTAAGASSQIA